MVWNATPSTNVYREMFVLTSKAPVGLVDVDPQNRASNLSEGYHIRRASFQLTAPACQDWLTDPCFACLLLFSTLGPQPSQQLIRVV